MSLTKYIGYKLESDPVYTFCVTQSGARPLIGHDREAPKFSVHSYAAI